VQEQASYFGASASVRAGGWGACGGEWWRLATRRDGRRMQRRGGGWPLAVLIRRGFCSPKPERTAPEACVEAFRGQEAGAGVVHRRVAGCDTGATVTLHVAWHLCSARVSFWFFVLFAADGARRDRCPLRKAQHDAGEKSVR
jgi:hypothetical protein